MTRIEFTISIVQLLHEMILLGEHPIIDYCKRSDGEQMHLFQEGKSKCDGVKILSKHQIGRAMDIYFVQDGKLGEPNMGFDHWHKRWREMDGAEMIIWDKGHWEG
jgi:hypothetical protein